MHGKHDNCNGDCDPDSFFRQRSPDLDKKFQILEEAIFDKWLLTKAFIDKCVINVGSTSDNESYHSIAVNRGYIRKNKSPAIATNTIDAGYKIASLLKNVGLVEAVKRVVGEFTQPISLRALEREERSIKKDMKDRQVAFVKELKARKSMKKYALSKTQTQSGQYKTCKTL